MKGKKNLNIKISKNENAVMVRVNPKIYPLPIIYQACDVFIDRAYVFIDGDPEKGVKIVMKPKDEKIDLNKLGGEFNNELLNYAAYFIRSQVNRDMREMMLKRAFTTASQDNEADKKFEEMKLSDKKIDLGAKVPLVDDTIEPESHLDSSKNTDQEVEEDEFNKDEIFAKWEDQKGAIKKVPKDLLDE